VRFSGGLNFRKKIIAALAHELLFCPTSVSSGWPHCGQACYMLRGIIIPTVRARARAGAGAGAGLGL
jgi:hypothetical protein